MVVSIYAVKHKILDLVSEGEKTIYEINNNLEITNFKNMATLRRHLYDLINAGSMITSFDPNKNATVFKLSFY